MHIRAGHKAIAMAHTEVYMRKRAGTHREPLPQSQCASFRLRLAGWDPLEEDSAPIACRTHLRLVAPCRGRVWGIGEGEDARSFSGRVRPALLELRWLLKARRSAGSAYDLDMERQRLYELDEGVRAIGMAGLVTSAAPGQARRVNRPSVSVSEFQSMTG
ncbi:hypothetical protein GY45DRAFT_378291 [Cubamyces sp. BRFM 1775]|nr:hypothetical protein GY45DRAFT_378291 [Cubamyces sp. BRFM 1775]